MKLDGWLFAACAARTCMTSVFMTSAAALPVLRTEWGMSGTAAGSISTGFQLGYAVSLVAFSALADRIGARRVFLGSAWLSAVSALAFGGLGAVVHDRAPALHPGRADAGGHLHDRDHARRRSLPAGAARRRGGLADPSSSAGYALSLLISGSTLAWGGYEAAFSRAPAVPSSESFWCGSRFVTRRTSFTRRAPACASAPRS